MKAFLTGPILLSLMAFCASGAALASEGEVLSVPEAAVEAWQEDPSRIFDASEIDLDLLKWVARPVIVLADTPADPRFREQMEELAERPEALAELDVMLIVDTEPGARSEIREKLRPRGFSLVLIGKDGEVKLRKPFPWSVRELSASIDKLPLRRDEIRRARSQ